MATGCAKATVTATGTGSSQASPRDRRLTTVESVTQIDPHDLILPKAIVYEAKGERHMLIQEDGLG